MLNKEDILRKTIFKSKKDFYIFIILFIGIILRIYGLGKYPMGLNQDEASAGYDAYSLLKYGIDRNGISYPVYLISWGSGQNALYSYLCMPFIALFGLNEFSIRLPMALFGCITLIVIYFLSKSIFNINTTMIITFFFAICPWHILKSRWALESNIFPDMILLSAFFLSLYIKKKRKRYIFIASLILGLSAYSYGTSYLFIPVFAIITVIILIKKRQIDLKTLFLSISIAFITALPILLFVIINTFDMEQMKLFFLTIPKLNVSRHMEISSVFSDDFVKETYSNFIETMSILVNQNDGLIWNGIEFYGTTYVVSLPFTVIGIYAFFSKKMKCTFVSTGNSCDDLSDSVISIINSWFIAAIIVSIMVYPNINRINIVWIPIAIYTGAGLAFIINNVKELRVLLVSFYCVLCVLFTKKYFGEFEEDIKTQFFYSLSDAITDANKLDVETIYVSDSVNMPYIFTLFYDNENPYEFLDSVVYFNENSAFEYVMEYGKYCFYLPVKEYPLENSALIVDNERLNEFDLANYKIHEFEQYSVIFVD